jgi:hypothetical protein
MKHDKDCEWKEGAPNPMCRCATRAYAADPMPGVALSEAAPSPLVQTPTRGIVAAATTLAGRVAELVEERARSWSDRQITPEEMHG